MARIGRLSVANFEQQQQQQQQPPSFAIAVVVPSGCGGQLLAMMPPHPVGSETEGANGRPSHWEQKLAGRDQF